MATATAMAVVSSVPESSGQMPKCFWAKSGVHWVSPKNCASDTSRKKPAVSLNSTPMMPTVVRIETTAQSRKKPETDLSLHSLSSRRVVAIVVRP